MQVTTGGLATGQDFALVAGGAIQGTLTNATGGTPVADANLTLTDSSGNPFYTTTDATGVFGFTGLPAGTYTLEYTPTNALPAQVTLNVAAGQTLSGVSLQVQLGGNIAGTVTSAAGGTPLANVPVFVITSAGDELDTQSDASGNYSFPNLPAGAYQVNVMGAPGSNAQTANVLQLDGTTVSANLSVSYSATITGTLQDASGNPIQGSVLLCNDAGDLITSAQCDSSGNYGLLLFQGGQFELQGIAISATFAPVSVTANAGGNLVQNIAAGSSALTVTVSSPGAAPTGAAANLYEYTENGLLYCCSATVDATGVAAFGDLIQGNYRLVLTTTDNYGVVQDFAVAGATSALNVTLSPLFDVSGVVTDPSGNAVNEATVTLTDTTGSLSFSSQSGADGAYSVAGVPAGTYTVSIVADGYQAMVQSNVVVAQPVTLNGSLGVSTASVTGRILDTTGTAVEFASVSILDTAGDWIGGDKQRRMVLL